MDTIFDALQNALRLIFSLDQNVIEYAQRSLYIALVATVLASILAIPLALVIAEYDFRFKRALITLLNTLMGVPTVVVGIFVYSFLSRQGPLGSLNLLFTEAGVIVGEVLLVLPLMVALGLTALIRTDNDVRLTALSLGAHEARILLTVFCESRFGILAAIIAGYGRVVGEVGIAMILGGNVDRFTRTMTTAIVLHIDMGYFEAALALGLVLLVISFSINILFQLLQGRGR